MIDSSYYSAARQSSRHYHEQLTAFIMALFARKKRIPKKLSLQEHSALLGLLIQAEPRPVQRQDPDPSQTSRRICLFFQHQDLLAHTRDQLFFWHPQYSFDSFSTLAPFCKLVTFGAGRGY